MTEYRRIVGLKWARECERPKCIPKGRPRGRKAAGLRYERQLAKALPEAKHGQWFEFEDVNGRGYCQTDLLLHLGGWGIAILECKYTWTLEAQRQLDLLYRPVVERAFMLPVRCVVVCKVLVPEAPLAAPTLGEALASGRVWHWLGATSGHASGAPLQTIGLGLLSRSARA